MNPTVFNANSRSHWAGYFVIFIFALNSWMPGVEGLIPAEWYQWIIQILGLVIIILRNITSTPITQR